MSLWQLILASLVFDCLYAGGDECRYAGADRDGLHLLQTTDPPLL